MPRARPARRIAARPTGWPCAASSARSLAVASGCPWRQPSPCAQATSAGPRAIASRQPRPPHAHTGPSSGSTTTCPMCPALPEAPSITRPSRMSPPPTPVETTMPSRAASSAFTGPSPSATSWTVLPSTVILIVASQVSLPSTLSLPRPAPRQCSAATRQIASLCTRTTLPANRSCRRARSGNDRHTGMLSGETRPAGHSIGPPHPAPTPARSPGVSIPASSSTRSTSASRVLHSCSASTSRGVGTCAQVISRPPGSATAAASLVPPTSMASAGLRSPTPSLPICAASQHAHTVYG